MHARATAPQKKSHQLVDRFLQHIRSGDWAAGVRLPSERVLAASHGVSRAAVREALSALQLAGAIETRVGDGSYVAQLPNPEAGERLVDAGVGIAETLEAREALDVACAALAIRNGTRGDMANLAARLAELRDLVRAGDLQRYLAVTLDFHLDVARAARNAYLLACVTELIEKHRSDQWLLSERYTPETAERSLRVHLAIGEAIQRKDLASAIAAVSDHYEHYPVLTPPHP